MILTEAGLQVTKRQLAERVAEARINWDRCTDQMRNHLTDFPPGSERDSQLDADHERYQEVRQAFRDAAANLRVVEQQLADLAKSRSQTEDDCHRLRMLLADIDHCLATTADEELLQGILERDPESWFRATWPTYVNFLDEARRLAGEAEALATDTEAEEDDPGDQIKEEERIRRAEEAAFEDRQRKPGPLAGLAGTARSVRAGAETASNVKKGRKTARPPGDMPDEPPVRIRRPTKKARAATQEVAAVILPSGGRPGEIFDPTSRAVRAILAKMTISATAVWETLWMRTYTRELSGLRDDEAVFSGKDVHLLAALECLAHEGPQALKDRFKGKGLPGKSVAATVARFARSVDDLLGENGPLWPKLTRERLQTWAEIQNKYNTAIGLENRIEL